MINKWILKIDLKIKLDNTRKE